MNYLVVGLESSCTRVVSKMIALSLSIINNEDEWDGHEEVFDLNNRVVHRSLPHGKYTRDNFISADQASEFDKIIVCTRDWNCSFISKTKMHQPNIGVALEEHRVGNEFLKKIYEKNIDKCVIFSYETAYLIQEIYTKKILKEIGIENSVHIPFTNVNEKYIMSTYGGTNA